MYASPLVFYGYHRISSVGDRPDTPVSEGEAERTIKEFAQRKGLEVEMLPVEKNVSGGSMQRPILGAAIERIQQGEARGIIVPHLDRLSRAELIDALETIRTIESAGGQVLSVREDFDVSLPEGKQARNMSLVMASSDLDRKKLYLRASKRSAVQRGVWPYPRVPIGYKCTRRRDGGDGKLQIDPAVAPTIIRAFEQRAAGSSWASIALEIGIGSTNASRIISNRVYLGELQLKLAEEDEPFLNKEAHDAIVSHNLFESAQIHHPRPARKGNAPALLAGLLRCAGCGGTLTPNYDGKATNYRCAAQPKKAGRCQAPAIIARSKIDEYVEAVVLPHIESFAVTAKQKTDRIAELQNALSEAEAERDLYSQITKASKIGAQAFQAGFNSRQAEVEAAAQTLASARGSLPDLPDLANLGELYKSWSVNKRRRLLGGSLAGIVVQKGGGSVPVADRVRIVAIGFDLEDDAGIINRQNFA